MSDMIIPSNQNVVWSVPEVACTLGISSITLLRMRQAENCGGLPFVRVSTHRIGYLRDDVLAYIASRRVGTVAKAA